jgi:hypothetical protein
MRRPTFLEGTGVALAASIGGSVLFGALTTVFVGSFVLRLIIASMGLLYLLYLLARSGEKIGRITSLATWLVVAALIWLMELNLAFYLMAHLGLIWLIRSLYFYSSLISALADLGLVSFGTAAAVWAILETGNLFLGFWSFFLIQALFVVIPNTWKRSAAKDTTAKYEEDRFQHAYRMAEMALTKLSIRA